MKPDSESSEEGFEFDETTGGPSPRRRPTVVMILVGVGLGGIGLLQLIGSSRLAFMPNINQSGFWALLGILVGGAALVSGVGLIVLKRWGWWSSMVLLCLMLLGTVWVAINTDDPIVLIALGFAAVVYTSLIAGLLLPSTRATSRTCA
jgi:hypothetical protein